MDLIVKTMELSECLLFKLVTSKMSKLIIPVYSEHDKICSTCNIGDYIFVPFSNLYLKVNKVTKKKFKDIDSYDVLHSAMLNMDELLKYCVNEYYSRVESEDSVWVIEFNTLTTKQFDTMVKEME